MDNSLKKSKKPKLNPPTEESLDKTHSKLLTVGEVANLLHLHPQTIRMWADRGIIECFRIGPRRDRRIPYKAIEQMLQGTK